MNLETELNMIERTDKAVMEVEFLKRTKEGEPITALDKHYAGFIIIFPKRRQEELVKIIMKEASLLGFEPSTINTTKIEE